MFFTLTVAQGEAQGRRGVLYGDAEFVVGRVAPATMSLPHDGRMSSRHFAIRLEHGVGVLRDLQSTNGTLVNGQPVTVARLRPGDRVQAGDTVFVFEGPPPAPPDLNKLIGPQAAWPYAAGLTDDNPRVRFAALEAAAWNREPWLLPCLRQWARLGEAAHLPAFVMLATLAEPEDDDLLEELGRSAALGPGRFEILAAWGHPRALPLILAGLDDADAADAAVAAFEVITGQRLPEPQPQGGDKPPATPQSSYFGCGGRRDYAEEFWQTEHARFAGGRRWAQGYEVTTEDFAAMGSHLGVTTARRLATRRAFRGEPIPLRLTCRFEPD